MNSRFNKILYILKNIGFLSIYFFSNLLIGQEKNIFLKFDNKINGSCIEQDDLGYIWLSATNGIYKYDGYDFGLTSYSDIFGDNYSGDRGFLFTKDDKDNFWISTYKGELTKIDKNGIKTSYKKELTFDQKPVQINAIKSNQINVWFGGTNGTLYKYNYKEQKIDSVTIIPKKNNLLQNIRSVDLVDDDEIWISTSDNTIYNYSIKKNEFNELKGPYKYLNQTIILCVDKNKKLWIATEFKGLFKYDGKSVPNFKQFDEYEEADSNGSYAMFISIFSDSFGNIWAGTDGDGLYKINVDNEKVTKFKHDKINNFSISNNTILNINEDKDKNIWIVSKDDQINIYPNDNRNVKYYNGLENETPTKILSILKSTKDQSLWIGTDGEGLNRVLDNGNKLHYVNSKKNEYFFKGKYIQSLVEDVDGNIWIATYQRGLWIYNVQSKRFTQIILKNSLGRESSNISFLFKDSKNRIWVTSGIGIHVFDSDKSLKKLFEYSSNGLFGMNSQSICEDKNGSIWVGILNGGLFKFNENIDSFDRSYFSRHNYYQKINNDYLNYNIYDIKPDFNGNLWILCASGFLIKYNLNDDTYLRLDKEVFKKKHFAAIQIVDPNNVWLSSLNGIFHYNLMSKTMTSFYQADGLQNNSFVLKSSFKDEDGVLYFGGKFGLNSFLPDQMVKKKTYAKLYVNRIEILNKPAHEILPDLDGVGVEDIKELKLKSNHSSFSFQFSALDNVLNSNYHYAYKLNGFDKEWIDSKNNRIATYTNIPYGDYAFEIKAGIEKGKWDIPHKKIAISIQPPWWRTNLAYLLYFLFISLAFYGLFEQLKLKRRLANEVWQNHKEKELYALKMNFFAKMSHEIQTPLTLILGPMEDMLQRAGKKGNELLRQRLLIINNNAKRLSRIATELMTLRNKELGKQRVFASKNDIIKHLKNISLSFTEQARFKKIDFIQIFPDKNILIWYDLDKIEHVIYNLLSNAFKFTPKEGNITLRVEQTSDDKYLNISIKDSGPGIPEEELDDIFKLFYQSDLGKHSKGFGIGLALTKELISLHKGTIQVESSSESGTTFTLKLLTGDSVFSEDEKIVVSSSKLLKQYKKESIEFLGDAFEKDIKSSVKKLYTILIVEDNIEMQILLSDILNKKYNVIIAGNGTEGIELANQHIPDIILSDVYMPIMDGIQMCAILQKNRKTAHVPIILVTARNTTKIKIRGLKAGAIQYIQKPFNFYELLLKINNIIASNEKILSKHKTEIANSPNENIEKSKDELFLDELTNELNHQLDNENFKLEDLSHTFNMSYSVIYRKCHEITGMTLVEYTRSIRLKKAALLIVKQGYNITEAAFMVGYKDSKYFTKCFKKEFGKSPNHFRSESKKMDLNIFLENYNINYLSDSD